MCCMFSPSETCKECGELRCELHGGTTPPSEMCGCDACADQHIEGDSEFCLADNEYR